MINLELLNRSDLIRLAEKSIGYNNSHDKETLIKIVNGIVKTGQGEKLFDMMMENNIITTAHPHDIYYINGSCPF